MPDVFGLLDKWVFVIGFAAAIIIMIVRRTVPWLGTQGWFARLLPIWPIPFAVGFSFLPGVYDAPWGVKLLNGIVSGILSAWGYKTAKTLFESNSK